MASIYESSIDPSSYYFTILDRIMISIPRIWYSHDMFTNQNLLWGSQVCTLATNGPPSHTESVRECFEQDNASC